MSRDSDLTVISPCPSCGVEAERHVYDIGSGRELSCANCEWCWGADGQGLNPVNLDDIEMPEGFGRSL